MSNLKLSAASIVPIALLAVAATCARAAEGDAGFEPIFDGTSLTNWESPDMSYWTVEDGAITGRITREHPCTVNQYLVWKGGDMGDFELKLQSRLNGEGAINNGFQFRSRLLADHDICGYQMDNNLQTPWLVRLYEEFGRHTLAMRGERTTFDAGGGRVTSKLDGTNNVPWFRLEDWHEYHLTCVGPKIVLRVNGKLAAEVEDHDLRRQAFQGVLGLQLHSGPSTFVQFKDIRLKVLKPAVHSTQPVLTDLDRRRVSLLAGASAWWPLDSGGHGATPPLRHVPGWEKFELNRRADGPGGRADARVVILDGAYFDAGPKFHLEGQGATVFLRVRDPRGIWNGGLIGKGDAPDKVHFNLFSTSLADSPGAEIGFKVRTAEGFQMISFPVSRIDAVAWHDLVGRYDGQNLALFCDGMLMASKTCRGVLMKNEKPLLIGAESADGKVVRHFRGEFEQVALWSRALSDDELKTLSRRQ